MSTSLVARLDPANCNATHSFGKGSGKPVDTGDQ